LGFFGGLLLDLAFCCWGIVLDSSVAIGGGCLAAGLTRALLLLGLSGTVGRCIGVSLFLLPLRCGAIGLCLADLAGSSLASATALALLGGTLLAAILFLFGFGLGGLDDEDTALELLAVQQLRSAVGGLLSVESDESYPAEREPRKITWALMMSFSTGAKKVLRPSWVVE